ncbi:MFS transporter [Roseicyclus persicicus]|uniref:MFS transporter n=1 Tax=Roseicyclus persicicus TaxID=2650661 RepID=A0A7X6GW88_9RHOB|nr:MFS transporter [Roseibacterium persicicum]NKX43516.1 MFS transporter [Roseibacterium persicicum]
MPDSFEETAFEALFDTETAGDLPDAQAAAEPRNALRAAASLTLTKLADGLIDPKLVLSWLLTALGAPALFVGLLVPIREAGALLPQLAIADRVHAMARRKWVWVAGSAGQGVAAAGIALAALALSGAAAGLAVCLCLAALAVSRSLCSVSFKDVLGKTVATSRRGTVTGLAGSVASAGVVGFAVLLMTGWSDRYVLVVAALVLAAGLWLAGAALFAGLAETASEPGAPGGSPLRHLALLRDDPQLARFVAVRGLLTGTALAPPFLVLMASGVAGAAFGQLGALLLASAAAATLSSYVWGRLSDRSSRTVLIAAGGVGALALAAAAGLSAAGLFDRALAVAACLFPLMIAYHGVRSGRSTYLVDMAPPEARAAYAAVSNTVIGGILLASGGFGVLASLAGPALPVWLFAGMCALASLVALGLDEVEGA